MISSIFLRMTLVSVLLSMQSVVSFQRASLGYPIANRIATYRHSHSGLSMLLRNDKTYGYEEKNLNAKFEDNQITSTNYEGSSNSKLSSIALMSTIIAATALMLPENAFAKGGEYGILEGRTASMLHPVTMLMLFCTSVYSGSLGLKWRQLRSVGEEIKSLNKELPQLSTGKASSPLAETVSKIKAELATLVGSEDNDTPLRVAVLNKDLSLAAAAAAVDSKIIELTSQRKQLQGQNLKDKHWLTGSVLLGVGVSVSILGAFNTYMRSGKLFPGPHLYAGMAITMLWAAAAALVPEMQKGNEAARVGHIALNSINVALFAWQVYTGLDIMVKVWGFTHWP